MQPRRTAQGHLIPTGFVRQPFEFVVFPLFQPNAGIRLRLRLSAKTLLLLACQQQSQCGGRLCGGDKRFEPES